MTGGRRPLSSVLAMGALFGFVLTPVVATVVALFFGNAQLAHGLQLFSWPDYSIENAAAKFRALQIQGNLLGSFVRSLLVAFCVGTLTAWSAMICAFCLSRMSLGRLGALRVLGFAAYLTPPVILVISLGWLAGLISGSGSAILVLVLGQCAYLFPLNYALSLGHWAQVAYEVDRSAASDGAGLFARLRVHMNSRAPSSAFFWGLALLTFMLSWSDVLFSRYLLMGDRDQRLLSDVVIEHLKANDVVAARGELAAVAFMTALVAAAVAGAYALMFKRANAGEDS